MKKFCCADVAVEASPRFTSGRGTVKAPSLQVRVAPEHEKVMFSSLGKAAVQPVTLMTSVALLEVQRPDVVDTDCVGAAKAGLLLEVLGALA